MINLCLNQDFQDFRIREEGVGCIQVYTYTPAEDGRGDPAPTKSKRRSRYYKTGEGRTHGRCCLNRDFQDKRRGGGWCIRVWMYTCIHLQKTGGETPPLRRVKTIAILQDGRGENARTMLSEPGFTGLQDKRRGGWFVRITEDAERAYFFSSSGAECV